MTQLRKELDRQTRLLGINLQGVNVGDDRQSVGMCPLDTHRRVPRRKKAQIPSTTDREAVSGHTKRGERIFGEWPGGGPNPKWSTWCARHAVAIVVYWVNARIVSEAQLGQDFERPKRCVHDGIGWCTISINRSPRHLLDDGFCPLGVLAQLLRAQPSDHPG